MAKDKPEFAPLPIRAMRDANLTSLELRALSCICWHDRLSEAKGGRGCFAANRLMAQEVGCTEQSLSRAIAKLISHGYIERDRQGVDGRRHQTVYRVSYEAASVTQRDKRHLSEAINDQPATLTRNGPDHLSETDETLVRRLAKNGGFPRLVHPQEKEENIIEPFQRDFEDFDGEGATSNRHSKRHIEERLGVIEKALQEGSSKPVEMFVEVSLFWRQYAPLDQRIDAVGDRLLNQMTANELAQLQAERSPV